MLEFFVNLSYIFLLAMHIGMHHCQNFEAESETIKGTNFKLVCSVDQSSFTGRVISLLKDGSTKSTCDNANNCLPFDSDSGRYQYFSNASSVTVEISAANHLTDSGSWKCKLGGTVEQDYELVVKTIPTFKNFTQTIPDSNSSELVENVKLSGRCFCIFPPPSVNLYFRVGTGAFQFLGKILDPFINKRNETSSCEPFEYYVEVSNFTVEMKGKTNVFFEMHFDDQKTSDVVGPFSFSSKGLTTPSTTFSLDMSTTVSEAPLPPITTSSTGLSQEIVITIATISCMLAAGLFILLVVQCRRKNKGTPPKNKKNHFANQQNNLTTNFKDDLKSYKPRKSKLIKKRKTKRGSSSIEKKKITQVENFAFKDRMYQRYPQTTNFWNNSGNQHVLNNSHNEVNMMFYGNRHENYLQPHSRPNNRMLYQSHYLPYPGLNEGMFQYYRADDSYRGQQMYQRPYDALYDSHVIDNKQDYNRSSKGRAYEKNWDLLY